MSADGVWPGQRGVPSVELAFGLPHVVSPGEAARLLRAAGLTELTECALRTRAYRKQVPFHLNGRRIVFTLADLREIAEGDGYEKLKLAAHKGLKGLKVAPFYGCQILRPSKIMGFDDPDKPASLERIIEACGGEAIDYPAKIKCCGFPIIQAREDTALGELIQPVEQAMEAGADVMVTPCPLCHLSLDAWQQKLEASTGRTFDMPVLHLAQLVGVAAGLEESELKFKRHIVDPRPALQKLEV